MIGSAGGSEEDIQDRRLILSARGQAGQEQSVPLVDDESESEQ